MSRLRQNGDDHPEAAGKHLDDAITLEAADRHDGAAYLAGYVVECSLKSLVLLEQGISTNVRSLYGHAINKLSSDVIKLAALPSAKTARYIPEFSEDDSLRDHWKETLRYRAPGTVSAETAGNWVKEAKSVYDSTIVLMRLDGVI